MLDRSSIAAANTRGAVKALPAPSAALLAVTDDLELRDLLLELAIEEGYGVRCVYTICEPCRFPGGLLGDVPAGGGDST